MLFRETSKQTMLRTRLAAVVTTMKQNLWSKSSRGKGAQAKYTHFVLVMRTFNKSNGNKKLKSITKKGKGVHLNYIAKVYQWHVPATTTCSSIGCKETLKPGWSQTNASRTLNSHLVTFSSLITGCDSQSCPNSPSLLLTTGSVPFSTHSQHRLVLSASIRSPPLLSCCFYLY